MKFMIDKHQFDTALSKISSIPDKRAKGDAFTGYILIEARGSSVTITANNLRMGKKATLTADYLLEEGSAFVEWNRFSNIFKSFKKDMIEISTDKDFLSVKQNKSVSKLKLGDVSQSYEFPILTNKFRSFNFDLEVLKDSISKIITVIDAEAPRVDSQGALIHIKGNTMKMVGTDLKRLAVVEKQLSVSVKTEDNIEVILHKNSLIEMSKLFSTEKIQMHFNAEMIIVEGEDLVFYAKFINAKFPNYERLIPSDNLLYQVPISTEKLNEVISIVSSAGNELKVTITNETFGLKTYDNDITESNGEIDLNIVEDGGYLPDNVQIVFGASAKYIFDFLQIASKNFLWCFREHGNLPSMLIDKDFKVIIMPLALKD